LSHNLSKTKETKEPMPIEEFIIQTNEELIVKERIHNSLVQTIAPNNDLFLFDKVYIDELATY
jgi:hypothetical protein